MMTGYTITMGGSSYNPSTDKIIHESGSADRQVHDAKIQLKADGVGTLTFTMPPDHPAIADLTILDAHDGAINVFFDNQNIFHGVVVAVAEDMDAQVTVTCKDELVLLEEAYIPPTDRHFESTQVKPVDFMNYVVTKYNEIAGLNLWLTVGNVPDVGEYVGSNQYKTIDVSYAKPFSALDAITKTFVNEYGCSVAMRRSGLSTYIDIYDGASGSSGQTVRFGENLIDYTRERSSEGLYTAVIPIGANYNEYLHKPPISAGPAPFTVYSNRTAGSPSIYVQGNYPIGEPRRSIVGTEVLQVNEDEYQIDDIDVIFSGEGTNKHYSMDIVTLKGDGGLVRDVPANSNGVAYRFPNAPNAKRTRARMLDGLPDATYTVGQRTFVKSGVTLYDEDAVARYGLRTQVIEIPSIKYSEDLLQAAKTALAMHPTLALTVEITAVDMALYSDGYNHLMAGQTVRVLSEPHGVDATLMTSDIDIDLTNPANTRYTLGVRPDTISGGMQKNKLGLSSLNNSLSYRM